MWTSTSLVESIVMRSDEKTEFLTAMPPRATTELDTEIGKRLRSRREMLGLTQTELGQRCGISAQQCHKYEAGLSGMRASRLIQFGSTLGVPVSFFFNGLEYVEEFPDDLLELLSDRKTSELIRLFSQITEPSIKHGLLEMARAAHRAQTGDNRQDTERQAKKA